jgi:hypothetical protein
MKKAKLPDKKMVKRYSDNLDWDLDGLTIPEAQNLLSERERYLFEKYPDAEVRLSYDPQEWENGYELNIVAQTLETDEEYDKRVALIKEQEAARFDRERKEYERLARKFG